MRRSFTGGLAVLLLLVAALTTCSQGIRLHTTSNNWQEYLVEGRLNPLVEAITECRDGKPVVVVESIEEAKKNIGEIWAHERVHVEQLMRLAPEVSCEQYEQWMTSQPAILLRHEAAAYCSQARWGMKEEPDTDPLLVLMDAAMGQAQIFSSYRDPHWIVPGRNIASLFIGSCPEATAYVYQRLRAH